MIKKYICPDCGHEIEIDEPELEMDNVFTCEDCGSEFIITKLKPFACESLDDEES